MRNSHSLLWIMAAAAIAVLIGVVQLTSPSRAVASHDLPCPDVDGNKQVTPTDLDLAVLFFGQFVSPGTGADVDGSGQVTIFDIMIVFSAIGTTTNCQDAPVHNPGSFPGQGDDLIPSLGTFRIVVAVGFRADFAGCPPPLWDGVSRLESPTLSDGATKIGRSEVHEDGDGSDTGGTLVGSADTLISDGDFSLVPQGFEGPPGTRELHTEVRTLNLTGGGAAVRAGTAAPARPISPGEVEAQSGSDFPADSFFNVFAEVDLPDLTGVCGTFPGATLYNAQPLIVRNSKIELLPPKVVYLHDNTTAVPVLFKNSNPPSWQAGDLFGHLVLAGHGVNFDGNDSSDVGLFEDFLAAPGVAPEMPLPAGVGGIAELPEVAGAPLETGGSSGPGVGALIGVAAAVATGGVALGGAAWYSRRRR